MPPLPAKIVAEKLLASVPEMTRWQLHVEKWKDGCGSESCDGARNVVLARGKIPCQVLFIGEAPGESENVLGKPFCGPAGKLLDGVIERAFRGIYRVAFTNVVGCIPRQPTDPKKKASEPDYDQCMACKPRLADFVQAADEGGCLGFIVRVGKIPAEYLDTTWRDAVKFHRPIPMIDITHPAAILRANQIQQGLMLQRCQVAIQNAASEYLDGNRV